MSGPRRLDCGTRLVLELREGRLPGDAVAQDCRSRPNVRLHPWAPIRVPLLRRHVVGARVRRSACGRDNNARVGVQVSHACQPSTAGWDCALPASMDNTAPPAPLPSSGKILETPNPQMRTFRSSSTRKLDGVRLRCATRCPRSCPRAVARLGPIFWQISRKVSRCDGQRKAGGAWVARTRRRSWTALCCRAAEAEHGAPEARE